MSVLCDRIVSVHLWTPVTIVLATTRCLREPLVVVSLPRDKELNNPADDGKYNRADEHNGQGSLPVTLSRDSLITGIPDVALGEAENGQINERGPQYRCGHNNKHPDKLGCIRAAPNGTI